MAPLTHAEVREVVELAALAPSVHNTQPWRFRWDGAALCVREDPSRGLPVLDPEGRERVLSCGAALQHAELAVHALGYAGTADISADPADPLQVGRIVVGPAGESTDDLSLAAAIPRRYTDRSVFDPEEVPGAALDRLRSAAEQHGAWLRPVTRVDERIAMAVLLAHADAAEQADPAYLAELAQWRTHEREQEGVPDAALPEGPVGLRGSEFALRDFDAATSTTVRPEQPPAPEHPLVVVIGTDHDDREDWIRAGMALGRVLLQATVDDLAASPMTQVVEVEPFRARLRQELGLVGIPQVVLRVGYGHGRMTTRRRPVDEILDLSV